MAVNEIEQLIKGGIIGAALGAWLSKDKEEGAFLGAIIGAIIKATFDANRKARGTNVSVLVAEKGKLFEIKPSGEKVFVKNLPPSSVDFPVQFKLQ